MPEAEGNKTPRKKFKAYPIGSFHIDIAELRTTEGKLHLFVAINRTSKFAYVELHNQATRSIAKQFMLNLIEAVPYKVHTVLTDNGIQFTDPAGESWTPVDIKQMIAEGRLFWCHAFEHACAVHDIDHRLTKLRHPWTNGQVERIPLAVCRQTAAGQWNRTIKQATVHRYFYETHDQLRQHLADFVNAYNYARHLKALKGLTPYEFICKSWTNQPERFILNPIHQMPGLNT